LKKEILKALAEFYPARALYYIVINHQQCWWSEKALAMSRYTFNPKRAKE
jgi:F0F1-type ATP synthase gamma subunit